MKILKTLAWAPFVALNVNAQNLINVTSFPATDYDVVHNVTATTGGVPPAVPAGSPLKRLGHLQAGTWSNGNATWCSLGRPIASPGAGTPNSQLLYGLTVNDETDRA